MIYNYVLIIQTLVHGGYNFTEIPFVHEDKCIAARAWVMDEKKKSFGQGPIYAECFEVR